MQRRKLMGYGLASVCLASGTANAQAIANLADVAGKWSGRVEPFGVKLELSLQTDGRFDLQQTAQLQINNSGKASLKNGTLILPLPVGGMELKLTGDGKLTGPYQGERIKGTATLTKS